MFIGGNGAVFPVNFFALPGVIYAAPRGLIPLKKGLKIMKKLLVALMAVLFLGSTTGMVFAQTGGGSTDTTTKVHKTHKKGHKKSKKGAGTTAPAPAAAPATTK